MKGLQWAAVDQGGQWREVLAEGNAVPLYCRRPYPLMLLAIDARYSRIMRENRALIEVEPDLRYGFPKYFARTESGTRYATKPLWLNVLACLRLLCSCSFDLALDDAKGQLKG